MPNEFLDAIQKEGLIAPTDEKGDQTPPAPSADKKETETSPSPQGGQPEAEKQKENTGEEAIPFHKHPRFKALISELNTYKQKFEEIAPQLQEIERLKGAVQPPSAQIPDWFQELYGDSPAAWAKYQSHTTAERQAMKAEILQELQQQQQQAVAEEQKWSKWVDDQIDTLHTEGKKFDDNLLKKVMAEYRPTDERGYLDFHKGFELYEKLNPPAKDDNKSKARKEVAAQTTETKATAEPKQSDIITSKQIRHKGWY